MTKTFLYIFHVGYFLSLIVFAQDTAEKYFKIGNGKLKQEYYTEAIEAYTKAIEIYSKEADFLRKPVTIKSELQITLAQLKNTLKL